jgi:SAM-dependent methyltransferase
MMRLPRFVAYSGSAIDISSDLNAVTQRFQEIASQIVDATDLRLDPEFYRYCASTRNLSSAAQYVRHQADLLTLAGRSATDAVIVDVGCGFGFTLIVHALLGARAVHGVEFSADMVATVEAYLPLLPPDVASRFTITAADATAMPLDDESADIVLSVEAISHYLDVDGFIDEAWRVLRPNGVLVIADQNNGANPVIRRRAYDIWEALELGPPGRVVPGGGQVDVSYAGRRAKVLADHVPPISDADRDELARTTAGFTKAEVVAAADAYIRDGVRPTAVYRRGQVAIHPSGMAMERLFVPRQLARRIAGRGFEAKSYAYFGGANGNPALRAANRVLSAMSAVTMPGAFSFRVIANKTTR